jgi:acetoin:2,6-dichlorophenolindophenol oxidoreductase subunit beta
VRPITSMPEVVARQLSYAEALREAQIIAMERDASVYVMGLGVPDPKGIFGSTLGLRERFGPDRVMDMPLAENAMTGVAIGAALTGMRPILTHQRVDFALLSIEQIVNQAAKWHYMFGGRARVPIVVRMIIGRGWGQGPQHSQSLQAIFAHIPGLKVAMPATAHDAKGMLIAAIEDDNPVIMLEHRWLYDICDAVPEGHYTVPLGEARLLRADARAEVTIIATSYMVLEALAAGSMLEKEGVRSEIVDLRTLRPLDEETILASVRRTGRLIVADTASARFGTTAEIIALVAEHALDALKVRPRRIASPDHPTPSSPALADQYYPRAPHIVAAALEMLGRAVDPRLFDPPTNRRLDQPDKAFSGPF